MTGGRYVYLSPHLDDAVLSCGGRLHQLARAGLPVTVVTVFAGSPPSEVGVNGEARSGLIAALHQRWQVEGDVPAARRMEDEAALRLLGVGWHHLDYLDCIYRRHPLTGEVVYRSNEQIFGSVHPAEFHLAVELAQLLAALLGPPEGVWVYAPLSVGHHVDHQLLVVSALRLQARGYRLAFYEDYPYAEAAAALERALRWLGEDHWQPEFWPLDAQDLAAKAAAVGCYRSQLSTFFDDAAEMALRLESFALTRAPGRGPCERVWHLTK
ncbi:MAG: PIG-L deacetylase family protein [Chloroflexota bacterium]